MRRLVTFVVDAAEADAIGDEPVWHDGKVVGWITSGGYAHYSGVSLALGYIPAELATDGTGFEIEIIGRRRPATLQDEPVLDPHRCSRSSRQTPPFSQPAPAVAPLQL